jgi:hypothetical protein
MPRLTFSLHSWSQNNYDKICVTLHTFQDLLRKHYLALGTFLPGLRDYNGCADERGTVDCHCHDNDWSHVPSWFWLEHWEQFIPVLPGKAMKEGNQEN